MKLLNWNTPIRLVKVTPLLTSLQHETLLNWKTSILDRASKNCTTFMASLRATWNNCFVKEYMNDTVLLRLHRLNSNLSLIQHRPKIRFSSLNPLLSLSSFLMKSFFDQETQGVVPRDLSSSIISGFAQMFSLLQSIFKILLRIYKKILLFLPLLIRSKLVKLTMPLSYDSAKWRNKKTKKKKLLMWFFLANVGPYCCWSLTACFFLALIRFLR